MILLSAMFFDSFNLVYASENKIIINGKQEKNNILLWNEEFNGNTLDDRYWKALDQEDFMDKYGTSSSLPSGMYDPNLYEVKNGCLLIKMQMLWNNETNKPLSNHTESIRSSRITSKDLIECKYGRIDIRAKMANGQGIWPMGDLLGNNTYGSWPACGQISLWNYRSLDLPPQQLQQMVYTKSTFENLDNLVKWNITAKNISTQFHLYSIEWSENAIKFFVDDNLTGCYYRDLQTKDIGKEYEVWPFDSPFYFSFESLISGTLGINGWTKIAEDGNIYTYEDSTAIDYIRIYSLDDGEEATNDNIIRKVKKKPAKVKIKSVKRYKKNKIRVRFKKVRYAKKYQIKFATNKKFKKAKIRTTKKCSYIIKKAQKKKKYYIKVRGVNGTKKGAWSKVKTVKKVK